MKLTDALSAFDAFLAARHLGSAQRQEFARYLVKELFPAVGRRLLTCAEISERFEGLLAEIRPELRDDERYGLNGFGRHLLETSGRDPLGKAMDDYLRRLEQRGVGRKTRAIHRRGILRLARRVVGETDLGRLPFRLLSDAVGELLDRRRQHLSSALRHFSDFLEAEGFAKGPLSPFVRATAGEKTLADLVDTADEKAGFEGALGRYLRELRDERQLSSSHLLSALARLLRFRDFVRDLGRETVAEVRFEDVATYRDQALVRGVTHFHHDLSAIRCFYAFLVRQGEAAHDPTKDIRSRVPARCPRAPLDSGQIDALLAAPLADLKPAPLSHRDPGIEKLRRLLALRDRAVLHLLLETGLRPAELRGLEVEDLDLLRGLIHVRGKGSRSAARRDRPAYIESEETARALRNYLAVRPVGPHRALFLSRRGAPLTGQVLCRIVGRRVRQAGIGRSVRPYDLRITFASRLVARGADPFALRSLMGHDDILTTFRLYARLSLEEVRDVWKQTNPLAAPGDPGGAA